MKTLAIYLPTYKRPHALAAVARNIEETTHNPFTLYFGLEVDDPEGIEAAKATGHIVIVNKYEPGYANTTQTMYEASSEPYWFHGNDDFVFLKDWDKAPIEELAKRPELMVLGVSDGNPSTNYWTISMVKREYIEKMSGVVDMPNRVFYPYNHNYIDTEFSQTAVTRGVWDKLEVPCIEHHHPGLAHLFGDTPKNDATYAKNDATAGIDGNTFSSRVHLFT